MINTEGCYVKNVYTLSNQKVSRLIILLFNWFVHEHERGIVLSTLKC